MEEVTGVSRRWEYANAKSRLGLNAAKSDTRSATRTDERTGVKGRRMEGGVGGRSRGRLEACVEVESRLNLDATN